MDEGSFQVNQPILAYTHSNFQALKGVKVVPLGGGGSAKLLTQAPLLSNKGAL